MTEFCHSAPIAAAWRDDEYAIIIPRDDEGIGMELATEMAHSPRLGSYVTNLQVALYELVGNLANQTNDDGKPVGFITGPLEAFGEPVPSIPANQFIVFAHKGGPEEEGLKDVAMGPPELHAQLEAAAILADAARTIREEGESNGSAD